MTVRIRIVGVGSPAGDDRLGWLAARALRRRAALAVLIPQVVTIAGFDRPGMGLLQGLEGLTALIVVDAVRSGAAAGTLHRLGVSEVTHVCGVLSSHGFGLAQTLELGLAMGWLPPQVTVFGLEMAAADAGSESLSAKVAAAMPVLIQSVEREVLEELARDSRAPLGGVRRSRG